MKKLFTIFFLLSLCSMGLRAQDRLQPAESALDTPPYFLDYSKALQKSLLSAEEKYRPFLFKYFVHPSFSLEYFLGLTHHDETYRLVHRSLEKSVWKTLPSGNKYRMVIDNTAVPVREIQREISPESAELLQKLMSKAIFSAEFPKPEVITEPEITTPTTDEEVKGETVMKRIRIRLDGTNYYFSIWNYEDYRDFTAKVWSPDKGSKTEALVDIFEKIIALMYSDGRQTVELDSALKNRIEKLISEW